MQGSFKFYGIMEQAKVLINLVAPQNLNIFYEGRISYGKKVLCYLSLQHNDVSENNTDDPKSSDDDATKTKKMNSARYNLFRYKSKDITDMTYNCKYPLKLIILVSTVYLPLYVGVGLCPCLWIWQYNMTLTQPRFSKRCHCPIYRSITWRFFLQSSLRSMLICGQSCYNK